MAATDTNVSTRTLADVKNHRKQRVATLLRSLADRIETSPIVDVASIQSHRELEDITSEGAEWTERRPQRGQIDDETFTIQIQLTPYQQTDEPDPED